MDGQLHDTAESARVSVLDHGLVVGDGVFEATKVTSAGAFALTRHLARMQRSAAALGLPAPDLRQVRTAVDAVTSDWRGLGKLRITYTGGRGPLGSQAAYGPPTLVVAVEATTPVADATSIVTAPWTRNERGALTGVKSTSYAENVRALGYATAQGATEAIFFNTAGMLCEGTGSNIFCVFGDAVVTPPLSAGPLAGITRGLVLEWAPVVERDISAAEAAEADEVFLTSAMRDVQGVSSWDGRSLAGAGAWTRAVAARFKERAAHSNDP